VSGYEDSEYIEVLRYIDHRSYPTCRARRPLLAECRPKFISVATWGARFQGCSTPSTRFNLCENCYNPICASCRELMEIENLFCSTALAVGLKPSASQGKARLRGLYRIISSTPLSSWLAKAKPACVGYIGLFTQRPSALGSALRSLPVRAMADYVFKDHQPSALRCEARLRGLYSSTFNVQPSTFNLQPPSTFNLQRSTFNHLQRSTFNHLQRSTFNVQRSTFNHLQLPSTFNLQPSTFNHLQRSTFNLQPSIFNLQPPSTFNLQPSTFNLQPSTFNLQPSTFTAPCAAAPLPR
jgi:hypothetical protein